MPITASPCSDTLSLRPLLPFTAGFDDKFSKRFVSFSRTARLLKLSPTKRPRSNWRFSCFKHDDSFLEYSVSELSEGILPGEAVEPERKEPNVKHNWVSNIRKASEVIFSAEPWTVPWTAKTMLQDLCPQPRRGRDTLFTHWHR